MSKVSKTSIYIDGYNLFDLLYQAQFCMTKADRIIAGTAMLDHCGKFIANFVKSYDVPPRRFEYVCEMIAEWEVTKMYLRMVVDKHLIHCGKSTVDKEHSTIGFSPNSIEKQIFELTSKIDDGISKWKSSTLKVGVTANQQ